MEVARTSMIHAAAPHFLWPFAVRYAAHQLNLWPRISLPETSPTLRWTGKVGDAPVFRVRGSRAFVPDTSADKLSARAIPCDFTFDESVPLYRLFPYRSAPPPPPPFFLAPCPPPVDPLPPQGPSPSGAVVGGAASGGAELGVAESEGAGSRGAEPGGEELGGSEPAGVEPGGAEPAGVETGGAESEGAESGGAEPRGAASSGGLAGASTRLSPQQLREWLVRCARLWSGALGAGDARAAGAGGTGVTTGAGAGDPTEPGAAGAGGSGAGGVGAKGAGAVDPGGTVRPRRYFVPLLQQVLGVPSSTSLTPPLLCPPPNQSQQPLQPASPLPAPSPYTKQSGGLTERREHASRLVSPVRTARCVPRSRPPHVPSTHAMALRPSSVPLHVPLPAPPASSLPAVSNPASDRTRATSPSVPRLLATGVTDPFFESAAASALVAELLDFVAACRLDYATALAAESAYASPPSVGGECALGTDVLEDRQEDFECLEAAVPRFASMLLAPERDPDAPDIPTPRSYAEAITGPYSSQCQAAMDAKMASWKSTGTYVDEVPPPGANIVDGMWIFRGVDYFQTISPTPKMATLWVLLHVATQRDYELHSVDFSIAFLQGSLHEAIWLRRPPGFTESFPAGTQWSLRRPVYGLCQAPRKWHDTLRTTLAALGFAPATADPFLFLRTNTSLPSFYILVYVDDLVFPTAFTEALTLVKSELQKRHTCADLGEVLQRFAFQFSSPQPTPLSTSHSLSAPPLDESVEPSGPYPELVGCLMYLMTCTRPDLAYPLSPLARYVAPGWHRNMHWDAAKRVLCYLCSTSGMGLVFRGRGPVVLTGHADSSWVDNSATQRSSQGYTFSLAGAVRLLRRLKSRWSRRGSSFEAPQKSLEQARFVVQASRINGGVARERWGERGLGREGGDVSEKGGCCVLTPLSPVPLFSVPPHPHPPFPASSPPGYYFRAGTGGGKNMWHIYLPGGAWCGSAAQCEARSKTLYGTSTLYPTDPEPNAAIRPPFYGMLSSNSTINPPFYNWNLVRLIYCDGAGYSGTAGRLEVGSNGTVLYLDGWNIIQAVIEDLQSKRGIKSAAQILLSGSSAGGQAVVALCDRIAAAFPWAPTKCIADSGFFIDSKDRVGGYSWRNGVKSIVALHKPSWPKCQD
ncbi:unnamed protein product, partial [Closterium sp. NIES-54]